MQPNNFLKRMRPGRAASGRLRVAAVSSLVLAVLLGGAGALWLSTRTSEPSRAASANRPVLNPPIRLDTLPLKARGDGGSAGSRRRDEPKGARSGSESEGAGKGPSQASRARAEKRREIAALAREDDLLEEALSGDQGPGLGTGEIVPAAPGRTIARFGRILGSRHAGIDIDAPVGTPVQAADAGRVAVSEVFGGYGKLICIQHTGTLSTCYAHLSRLRVDEGEAVASGDVIARSGCSGRCYDDHLHFEVRDDGRAVNPKGYL
jgi:murein DD-endopeptidase MepM/ murein hydrolase activator NlpD